MTKIGLTLGSGGARGLAQIVILEAFEELGIAPAIVSGSSVGAVIGAVYCSGFGTKQMKKSVAELLTYKSTRFWEIHKRSDIMKLFDFFDPGRKIGGIIKGEKFVNYLSEHIGVKTFEELKIPLKVVATDFKNREQVVYEKGDLLQAVRASYSLPGLFAPVPINGSLMMDGGMVNPLPFDVIAKDCDICIAVDATSKKYKNFEDIPPAYEILFSAFQLMQDSIATEKLKNNPPDIFIRTNIQDVRMLEFNKIDEIFAQALPYKEELKRKLTAVIEKAEKGTEF